MKYFVALHTDCPFSGSSRTLTFLVQPSLKICCDLDSTHLQTPNSPHNTPLHETPSIVTEESIFVVWGKN